MNMPVKISEDTGLLHGMTVLEPSYFSDKRGQNFEGYNQEAYTKILGVVFNVDSFSISTRGVIRGFHGDSWSGKLIQVPIGFVRFVAIDLRSDSPTFKRVYETELNVFNKKQVYIPAGIVNAHQCLSEQCLFSYKLTNGYAEPHQQIHLKYNEINWPIKESILSDRDRNNGKKLCEF